MQIYVEDTYDRLFDLWTAKLRPKDLLARAQNELIGPGFFVDSQKSASDSAKPVADRYAGGFGVMETAQRDGYGVVFGMQGWGLFSPTRLHALSAWAFVQFKGGAIFDRSRATIERVNALLPGAALPPELRVVLIPADPSNRNIMVDHAGLSCFGGMGGSLIAEVWPSQGNMARLQAALARAYVHNLRLYGGHALGTLADYLVTEGLAAAVVAALWPDLPEPWLASFQAPADWPAALAAIAHAYGVDSFSQVRTNIYGMQGTIGAPHAVPALPLSPDDLSYAMAMIGDALATSDDRLIAAHLYGDAIVGEQGHPTVGLPPYAGFEAAYRLVGRVLAATGMGLAAAIRQPASAILAQGGGVAGSGVIE